MIQFMFIVPVFKYGENEAVFDLSVHLLNV